MDLKKRILEILDENSGGMKLTELVTHLSPTYSLEDVLEALDKLHPQVKKLEYTWKRINRGKEFIYTP